MERIRQTVFKFNLRKNKLLKEIEFMENLNKIITAATDEIFTTIEWSMKNNDFEYHVGSYWVNDNYNIFASTVDENEKQYIELKLEKYDNNEDCIDCEYDSESSVTIDSDSLKTAITELLKRNQVILGV
jgi:hypothetical protein